MDDEIIRIVVSTDNHLGYAERDPIRCNDSFAAFEEVLQTAQNFKADFVLLAGDMFHENKPSRRTLHCTMELLRTYCLGENPVYMEILNDQKEIFRTTLGRVNYEDPFQSIGLPVFAIHGNHDDPSREGGQGESLAALDLLAVTNLINYFGKSDKVEDVEITPILIRKGSTMLAIYGLGAMRDERLNRMWNQKKVKFVRLTEEQGRDMFFNVFVLHQNRDYGRGKKNCIHESMIPEWMDLVIWGNEHECQPQLAESLVGTFRVLQPGSSVATSLSSTESALCPKHLVTFEIRQKKFRFKAHPYSQVRMFLYDDVALRDLVRLDPTHPKIEEHIKEVLARKVNEMLKEGRRSVRAAATVEEEEQEEGGGASSRRFSLIDPHKIILRLRVDHEGFPSVNQQRFGAQFIGEVANPNDILLMSKKKREVHRAAAGGGAEGAGGRNSGSKAEDWKAILAEGAEEEMNKIRIEDLVNETLTNNKNQLSLLAEGEMAQALEDFVVKKHLNAILDLVSESLERTQAILNSDKSTGDKSAIVRAAERIKAKTEEEVRKGERVRDPNRVVQYDEEEEEEEQGGKKKGNKGRKSAAAESDNEEEDRPSPKAKGRGAAAASITAKARAGGAATTTAAASRKGAVQSKLKFTKKDEEEEEEQEEVAPRRTTARAAAKKTTKYAVDDSEEEEGLMDVDVSDAEEDVNEEQEEEEQEEEYFDSEEEDKPKKKKRGGGAATGSKATSSTRGKAATTAAAKKGAAAASKSSASSSSKKKGSSAVIDLEEEQEDISEDIDEDLRFTARSGGSKSQSSAAVKRNVAPLISQSSASRKPNSSSLSAGWDD